MVLRTGLMQHEKEALGDVTFSRNPMAPCAVNMGPRSLPRSDAPNMMERSVSSMPPGSLTVAPVPYASAVKGMAPPPKNLVGSVLSCIRCLRCSQKSSRQRVFLLLPYVPSFGGSGLAASLAVPGYNGNARHLVTVEVSPVPPPSPMKLPFSRAERAHWRMRWLQRLARNARPLSAPPIEITIYGLSPVFAQALGLRVA